MKKIFSIFVMVAFLSTMFMVVSSTQAATTAGCTADGDEEYTVYVSGGTTASPDAIVYNVSTIYLPESTCVKIVLKNLSSVQEHDISVDTNGDDTDAGNNETATVTDGTTSMFFMTPDVSEDTTIKFWCTVEGHRAQGMEGKLIVQNQTLNSGWKPPTGGSPGFELLFVIIASISLVGLKKFKN